MTGKAIDFHNMQKIEKLRRDLCDQECRGLGFIVNDPRGVTALTTACLGYLIFVDARQITSVAEAFAAGYQCAAEFHISAIDFTPTDS